MKKIEPRWCECGNCEDVDIRRSYRHASDGEELDYRDYMYCKNCGGLVDVCP